MPESMSVERRRIMAVYGATVELTARELGFKGALEKAIEILETTPNAWMPQQFENPANIEIHKSTTAQEILQDFPEGIDYLITGVGTGGHITGTAEVLKKAWPKLQVIAVEPDTSVVISGDSPGPHPIQGIGGGFIPKNLHTELLDGVVRITGPEAFEMTRRLAKEEGIFGGISSGASLAAVQKKLSELPAGSRILTFCYDTGERYLSVDELFK
jgi:cysteine synthase A